MNDEPVQVFLEKQLLHFYPQQFLQKYIKNSVDIYENRALLKQIALDDDLLSYLVNIIIQDLDEKRRIKKIDCITVLKRIIKNVHRTRPRRFDPSLVKSLFYLYKTFIYSKNEDMQWNVSALIKDQILDDEDLVWLISKYRESNHFVNRLLRYPEQNEKIKEWAAEVYIKGELLTRTSEIIGILIEEDIPDFVKVTSVEEIMWGIYYSKCSDECKRTLMKKYMDLTNIGSVVAVAIRLSYPDVIEALLVKHRSPNHIPSTAF